MQTSCKDEKVKISIFFFIIKKNLLTRGRQVINRYFWILNILVCTYFFFLVIYLLYLCTIFGNNCFRYYVDTKKKSKINNNQVKIGRCLIILTTFFWNAKRVVGTYTGYRGLSYRYEYILCIYIRIRYNRYLLIWVSTYLLGLERTEKGKIFSTLHVAYCKINIRSL